MATKEPKYEGLKTDQFDLPKRIDKWELELLDEKQFLKFLIRNDWVQRLLGIKMNKASKTAPDIRGEIYDGSGDKIYVEVEYWAENYKLSKRRFADCDLVLSFFRQPDTRIIKGVPVWSFYVGQYESRFYKLCLFEDINTDFYFPSGEQKTIKKIKREENRITLNNDDGNI